MPVTERPIASARDADRKSDIVLERLDRLHPKIIDLTLDRVERLLASVGHPERALPPAIHVAGTNGKGSVIAFLRAMLEAAGQRVQVYTSPHLVRFHERIRLAGGLIDEAGLVALLEECESANGEEPITFFEITTVAAFLAYARQPADILLLETGLGGRLDATNVLEKPALTVITPVSIDHVQYLGETLAEIAFEKAGILKAGVPAVIAPQRPVAREVIESRAATLDSALYRGGLDWDYDATDDGFAFRGAGGSRLFREPVLPGEHQLENAACAVACAEQLTAFGLGTAPGADTAIAEGLATADWPGRLQRITAGRLRDLLPDGWELWLDGGHNASAGQALGRVLGGWRDRPLHLVFGLLDTKAADDFLRPILPFTTTRHALAIPGVDATLSTQDLIDRARAAGTDAAPRDSVRSAIAAILAKADRPGRILICGSLYLAGHVLGENRG